MRGADPSCSTASLPSPARSRAERGRRGRADGRAEPRVDAAATRDRRATAVRGEGRSTETGAAAAPRGSLPPLPPRSWRRARVGASRGEPARGGSAATARRRARLQPTASDCAPDPSGARGGNRTSRARTRRSTRCLFSRPMPTTSPASSHWRSSPPPRIRVTTYTSVTQTSTSKVVVESRCPTAIAAPDAAVASAATACPARPAPSSRAIRATSTTTRAIATADSIRRPRGSVPNAHSEKRPSSGVRAGWSSYPQAGCRAATRKYSSSR